MTKAEGNRAVDRAARTIYLQRNPQNDGGWKAVETKGVWHNLARQVLKESFSFADAKDWERLFGMIDDSGHGRFWKALLTEIRDATETT